MSFLGRNGLVLRGIAVALTAYCVLASGRAMVPGLCATLADLDAKGASACCKPVPSCCHTAEHDRAFTISAQSHACAFCQLVHTAATPNLVVAHAAPAIDAPRLIVAHDEYAADPASAGCFLRRAPPLA